MFQFFRSQIERLRREERPGTAKAWTSSFNSYRSFRKDKDMEVEAYESWMLRRGLSRNTTSFYLRTLRTAYNLAVRQGLAPRKENLFANVYTGFDKTRKRAVSLAHVRALLSLDLSSSASLRFARDMFLFSFYMRGMPFVDMAYLRKTDLRGNVVTYRRRKTRQLLSIEWEEPMRRIVSSYVNADSPYMLPIISDCAGDTRKQYQNVLRNVNRGLRRLSSLIGLDIPLSSYSARHTWASAARQLNIPVSVISEGMGHDSEKTTRIYLASLDTSVIDGANRKIIGEVLSVLACSEA